MSVLWVERLTEKCISLFHGTWLFSPTGFHTNLEQDHKHFDLFIKESRRVSPRQWEPWNTKLWLFRELKSSNWRAAGNLRAPEKPGILERHPYNLLTSSVLDVWRKKPCCGSPWWACKSRVLSSWLTIYSCWTEAISLVKPNTHLNLSTTGKKRQLGIQCCQSFPIPGFSLAWQMYCKGRRSQ